MITIAFEEALKNAILSMIGAGLILAYSGFQLKDDHLPLRLFFILLSILMIPLMFGVSLQGLNEQGGATPTAAQNGVINMVNAVYYTYITVFVFVLGYFMLVFIRWIIETMRQYKNKKLLDEEVIK